MKNEIAEIELIQWTGKVLLSILTNQLVRHRRWQTKTEDD